MTLEDYYNISIAKIDKSITDIIIIELYELKNKKKGTDK